MNHRKLRTTAEVSGARPFSNSGPIRHGMAARLQSMRVVHAIQVTYGMRQGAASHSRTRALFRSVSSTLSTPRAVPPLHFDRFPLDRAGEKRRDQACVNTMIQSPDSIVVMFIDGKPVVGLRGSEAVKSFSTLSGDNLLDAQVCLKPYIWDVSLLYLIRSARCSRAGKPCEKNAMGGVHGTV